MKLFLSIVGLAATSVLSHSWIDCIDHDKSVVYDNSNRWVFSGSRGHGVCEGYARNYPGRGTSSINTFYTYRIDHKDVARGHPVCQFDRDGAYNSWRKMIHAKPGDKLYFAYFPNGHISKDKWARPTQYGIYWSGQPNTDLQSTTQLGSSNLVNGQLQNFDDGNCGESYEDGDFRGGSIPSGRAGDGKPCVGSFTIPTNAQSGTYSFVWFWTFYKTDDEHVVVNGYYGAAYSSCFDVVVEGSAERRPETSAPVEDTPSPVEETSAPETPSPVEETSAPVPETSAPETSSPETPSPVEETSAPVPETSTPETSAPVPETPSGPKPIGEPVPEEPSTPTIVPLDPTPTPSSVSCRLVERSSPEPTPQNEQTLVEVPTPVITPVAPAPESIDSIAVDSIADVSVPESIDSISESSVESESVEDVPAVTPVVESEDVPEVTPTDRRPVSDSIEASVTVTSVGGTGSYGRVSRMDPGVFGQSCPSTQCVQVDQPISGSLAPFNEEISVAFRGPMTIHNIGVYEPSSSGWESVSSYNQETGSSSNLVFMNNKGNGKDSGIWTTCGGNSASFASADGSSAASSPQQFNGRLHGSTEVHIMSGSACTGNTCGFHRPTGYHGWTGSNGGKKIFIVRAVMPNDHGDNMPAIWMLNAQVVRTAQYGCNCRGMGDSGQWKGGCGEFDVAEVLSGNKSKLTSTIYSFKGSRGAGEYADRPTNKAATFVVVFDTANGGIIKVLMLGENDVDFSQGISSSRVSSWLSTATGTAVDFNI